MDTLNGNTPSPEGDLTPSSLDNNGGEPVAKKGHRGFWGKAGAAVLFLLAKLKTVLLFLKTGLSMIVSMWLYAIGWGWPFAAGFVLLIFIHECGHLLMARRCGIKVSAPLFIPFVGAAIALKESPKDAWTESKIAIGGPLLGSLGAFLCVGLYALTHQHIYMALAYIGFIINLFNLIPLGMLDGGRIVKAITPWLMLVGIVIAVLWMIKSFSIIILVITLLALQPAYRLICGRHDKAYYVVTGRQRVIMSSLYLVLLIVLSISAYLSYTPNPAQASAKGKVAASWNAGSHAATAGTWVCVSSSTTITASHITTWTASGTTTACLVQSQAARFNPHAH
jgi:Zn-dependent protease